MKIFRSEQIREIDAATIKNEPVSSIELMERAAGEVFRWIIDRFGRSSPMLVFTGPGNNGGDGLALARMLSVNGYDTEVYHLNFSEHSSADWEINMKRLKDETSVKIKYISVSEEFPAVNESDIIIDAIFGSGLARPAEGLAGEVIKLINETGATIISIDIPSGLFGEDNSNNSSYNIIRADYTLSFQLPKLAFMFPENADFSGEWIILPIGLNKAALRNTVSPYAFTEKSDIKPLIRERKKFDHKGIYGHGLLISGSWGKMGSAILGAEAALRSGIGLITCRVPSSGRIIIQTAVPEAMVITDRGENYISNPGNTDQYTAIGIGPGLGTEPETMKAVNLLVSGCRKPMVIDADGLNILSMNKEWLSSLPQGTILTPHPKEFERLEGKTSGSYERLEKQISFSARYKCIVVLKGAYTSITYPDGRIFFNSTGNPGMATAGSGDALTGIILSLLAQGYSPENAALAGVYLHGLAGDIAAEESCFESILASDIINNISKAFNRIKS